MKKFGLFINYLLILGCCALLAFLLYKVGDRIIAADFVRPFFLFLLTLSAIVILSANKNRLVRALSYLYGFLIAILAGVGVLIYRYYRVSETSLRQSDIYAILQTNAAEASSFIFDKILTSKSVILGLSAFVGTILFIVLQMAIFRPRLKKIKPGKPLFLSSLLAVLLLAGSFALFCEIRPVKFFAKIYQEYYEDLAVFNQVFSNLTSVQLGQVSKAEGEGELYVIVIGESASRDYMHGYGGMLNNTPWLDNIRSWEQAIVFENAYSYHTHTVPSLCSALTDGRALTGLTFPHGQNIINVSRQAGFKTIWLSNQANLGRHDSPITALAQIADKAVFTEALSVVYQDKVGKDEELITLLEEELNQLDNERNILIVIHLMGSHSPYEARYPQNFPEIAVSARYEVGKLADDSYLLAMFNHYSTSLGYTDFVLQEICNRMQMLSVRPAVMLYFADHGEDILFKHGSHNFSSFTWSMARIPMLAWLSPAYWEKYSEKAATLRDNREEIFTTDLIFDLYLGLAGINSEQYLASYDISSKRYALHMRNAIIAEERKISSDSALVTMTNAKLGKPLPIAAHRSNTLFKVAQARQLGIKSFEIDLIFAEKQTKPALLVGHDNNAMSGLDLNEHLQSIGMDFEFLWLDIKNLNSDNSAQIYALLGQLDSKLHLRQRVLIESTYPDGLDIFSRNGWQTSYYLPVQTLKQLSGNERELSVKLNEIATKVKLHQVGGVGYAFELDQMVQNKLTPLLPPGCKFYAYNLEWSYADVDLPEKLERASHLSCLLIMFKCGFDL